MKLGGQMCEEDKRGRREEKKWGAGFDPSTLYAYMDIK